MSKPQKGKSPFYPGQPVPIEAFVGRTDQVEHIRTRGVGQVEAGKSVSLFVEGEYGIGKSSLATFMQRVAEQRHKLHPIYVPLGGASTLAEVVQTIAGATLQSGVFKPDRAEVIRNWMSKYIGKQSLFGITLNLEALKQDVPATPTGAGLLDFLGEVQTRLASTGVSGIFLVLDEINGITKEAKFAHFIKSLVDSNAMRMQSLPLLLMLCGVKERRLEMIQNLAAVDRIFDVVPVEALLPEEVAEFTKNAFDSIQYTVTSEAIENFVHFAGGLPKFLQVMGDEAFWLDQDGVIDLKDAKAAIVAAADTIGRKYVDPQVYAVLRSSAYRSILHKMAQMGQDLNFSVSELEAELTEEEKGKLPNFLRRMTKLNVIRKGETKGSYMFNVRMVRVYIGLKSQREKQRPSHSS